MLYSALLCTISFLVITILYYVNTTLNYLHHSARLSHYFRTGCFRYSDPTISALLCTTALFLKYFVLFSTISFFCCRHYSELFLYYSGLFHILPHYSELFLYYSGLFHILPHNSLVFLHYSKCEGWTTKRLHYVLRSIKWFKQSTCHFKIHTKSRSWMKEVLHSLLSRRAFNSGFHGKSKSKPRPRSEKLK